MSEMIERVAARIYACNSEGPWPPADKSVEAIYRQDAHAAIEAMRWPTWEMFDVANGLEAKYKKELKSYEVAGFCALIYQAMIDEALK